MEGGGHRLPWASGERYVLKALLLKEVEGIKRWAQCTRLPSWSSCFSRQPPGSDSLLWSSQQGGLKIKLELI